jgi:DNA polymerase/3'-5' exonuclease PolX
MECKSFELLKENYPKIKEDLKKIAGVDRKGLVEKWTSELRTKWPHCILSCASVK